MKPTLERHTGSEPVALSPARLWSIVGLVTAGMIIAYLDRTNLSVALAAPEFRALFNLSDNDRGLLNSAFFWSYALLQIPAGYMVDRWGVKKPFAFGFLAWSLIARAGAAGLRGCRLVGPRPTRSCHNHRFLQIGTAELDSRLPAGI